MANVYSSRRKVNRDKSIMILRFFSLPGGILTVPDQVSDEELVLDPSHLTWSKNYTEKTNIGLVTGDKTVDHNTQVFFLAKPCSPLTMPSVIAPLRLTIIECCEDYRASAFKTSSRYPWQVLSAML